MNNKTTTTKKQRYVVREFPYKFSWTDATPYAVWDTKKDQWAEELSEFISTDKAEVQECSDRWNGIERAYAGMELEPVPAPSPERVREALQSSLARARAELTQTRDDDDKQAEYWEAVGRVTLCKRLARELGVELEWVDEREV